MKRIIAIILAAVMIAVTFAGCTDGATKNNEVVNENETTVFDVTKLDDIKAKIAEKTGESDTATTVVSNIDGYNLTLGEYEYLYFSYLNNALQYTMYYGFEILEDPEFLASIEDMFKTEIKTAPVILKMAENKGIELTEEEFNESVLGSYDDLKEQYGEDFEKTFTSKGTPSLNTILYYNYIFALYDKILASYSVDAAEVEAELAENYVRAKHVLVQFPENEDGSEVTEEQKAECLAEANLVLEKAKAGEDFDDLINEYNDDPGMTTNTDGYYFTYNEMVPEFETATFELEDNGISEVVETSYGYHIIKKLPVDDAFKSTETYKTVYDSFNTTKASDVFYNDMTAMSDAMTRADVENFDEIVAPVLAEATKLYDEYKVQYYAMYGSEETDESAENTESETTTESEEAAETEETAE